MRAPGAVRAGVGATMQIGNLLCRARHIPVLDLTSHGHKSLLHISGILGTGLQEWDANLVSKSLCKFKTFDGSIKGQILQLDTSDPTRCRH